MRSSINWGYPIYILAFFVFSLNLLFLYYFILFMHPISFLLFLPTLALDIVFFQVYRGIFLNLFRKDNHDLSISFKGIELKKRFHPWESIKSISFDTGRVEYDNSFCSGIRLPALQKIYLLDNDGVEHSGIIDIDYSLKNMRDKNNLIEAKRAITNFGRINLLSDWAQKHQ